MKQLFDCHYIGQFMKNNACNYLVKKEYVVMMTRCLHRGAAPAVKASGFLLSVLSPVWRAKICGDVGGNTRWQLDLAGDDSYIFSKLVMLGCGTSVTMDGGVDEVVALGRMADLYQVEVAKCAVEDALLSLLTVESCVRILASSWKSSRRRAASPCNQYLQ